MTEKQATDAQIEANQAAEDKADAKAAKVAAEEAPALANPDIHQSAAERAILQMNRDALAAAIASATAEMALIDEKLKA